MCSRGHQASLITAITQDTRHTATCCSVSAITSRSVAAAAASSLMRFSPGPSCRGDAANPRLESAFISHVGCVSRHRFVCFPQSLVIAVYSPVGFRPIVCSSAIRCPCKARSSRFSLVLERSVVLDWWRRPVSSGAVHRQHVFCSHGHVSGHVVLGGLPDALSGDRVSVSSSTPWTAVSKIRGRSHQRGGDMGKTDAAHDGHSRRTRRR